MKLGCPPFHSLFPFFPVSGHNKFISESAGLPESAGGVWKCPYSGVNSLLMVSSRHPPRPVFSTERCGCITDQFKHYAIHSTSYRLSFFLVLYEGTRFHHEQRAGNPVVTPLCPSCSRYDGIARSCGWWYLRSLVTSFPVFNGLLMVSSRHPPQPVFSTKGW
mgnify:CR=1 FL=1